MTFKAKPNTQIQGQQAIASVSCERLNALFKLIQVEPECLRGLVNATGWGEEQTRMALLQLTVDGKIGAQNRAGRKIYFALTSFTSTSLGETS